MKTIVEKISGHEHATLCGLLAKLLPHMAWRHNGLGLLQGYLHEGSTHEQRVHVWHESLKRPGIEESGLLHDHRFNLTSTVLVGALNQVEYDLREDPEGKWQLHSVVPARKALAASGTNDGLVEPLPERYVAYTREVIVREGERYFFPKFNFHGTYKLTELVVTIVNKTEQEEAQAKILAPYGKKVVHAFADPYPEESWKPVLAAAYSILYAKWARWTEAPDPRPDYLKIVEEAEAARRS